MCSARDFFGRKNPDAVDAQRCNFRACLLDAGFFRRWIFLVWDRTFFRRWIFSANHFFGKPWDFFWRVFVLCFKVHNRAFPEVFSGRHGIFSAFDFFGIGFFRDWIFSGLDLFGVVFFRDCIFSELDFSGLYFFGIGFSRMPSVEHIVRLAGYSSEINLPTKNLGARGAMV